MPSIAAVAAQLHADDRPVLLPDACILLDIIRATLRCLSGAVPTAADLLGLLTSSPPRMPACPSISRSGRVERQRVPCS